MDDDADDDKGNKAKMGVTSVVTLDRLFASSVHPGWSKLFPLVSPGAINSPSFPAIIISIFPTVNQPGQRPIVSTTLQRLHLQVMESQFVIGHIVSQSTPGLKDCTGNAAQFCVSISNNSCFFSLSSSDSLPLWWNFSVMQPTEQY